MDPNNQVEEIFDHEELVPEEDPLGPVEIAEGGAANNNPPEEAGGNNGEPAVIQNDANEHDYEIAPQVPHQAVLHANVGQVPHFIQQGIIQAVDQMGIC